MDNNFEVRVRAVIENNGKILVCKHTKNKAKMDYYFLPGGHVEFGETAKEAIIRELKEEVYIDIKNVFFIGSSENIFKQKDGVHHEINLVFNVIADKVKDKSKEDHIDFLFLSKREILKERVLPKKLIKAIIKWQKDKNTFWVSK